MNCHMSSVQCDGGLEMVGGRLSYQIYAVRAFHAQVVFNKACELVGGTVTNQVLDGIQAEGVVYEQQFSFPQPIHLHFHS